MSLPNAVQCTPWGARLTQKRLVGRSVHSGAAPARRDLSRLCRRRVRPSGAVSVAMASGTVTCVAWIPRGAAAAHPTKVRPGDASPVHAMCLRMCSPFRGLPRGCTRTPTAQPASSRRCARVLSIDVFVFGVYAPEARVMGADGRMFQCMQSTCAPAMLPGRGLMSPSTGPCDRGRYGAAATGRGRRCRVIVPLPLCARSLFPAGV